jgi:alpha-1,4-digalacturonate transport system substrate-binding protein
MKQLLRRAVLVAAAALLPACAYAATEVRIMWYSDGNEGDVLRDLLDRFEKANPDITVVLDRVPYKTINENLPALVSSGQAPDMARVTDLGGQSDYYLDIGPYLKDRDYWEKNFAQVLPWVRPPGNTNGIFGLPTQLTVTMPIVNDTLFQQAGIPLPGPNATWDDWAKAAKAVAQKTNTPIPLAFDRSGHRMAGLAISMGAKFFDADGKPELTDDGFKTAMKMFYDWHRDGTMSKQIWGSVGGASYRGANEEFANGQVVVYFSGNWQFPQFAKTIGDAFDWHGVPEPCGPVACTGMPGGAFLVPYKSTKHPQEVARLMDYLASEPVYEEYHARTLFLTASAGLAAKGVAYKVDLPQLQKSLAAAAENVKRLSPLAYKLQGYRYNRILFNTMIVRINQAIAGEMSLEDALARMTQDVAEGLKAQGVK